MCTVVFIPGEGKYYMASLRDEDPNRAIAHKPVLSLSDQQKFIAPIDPQGGGTWVGVSENGFVIVLLNGGFLNHTKKGPYAKSRGLIVTELLSMEQPVISWNYMDLTNIEPFTLIVWSGIALTHLVWDGIIKYQMEMDPAQAYIWSSATLYNESDQLIRQAAFENWISQKIDKGKATLFDFFNHTLKSNESIFIKDGANLKTLSYTFIEIETSLNTSITYYDILADMSSTVSLNNK